MPVVASFWRASTTRELDPYRGSFAISRYR